MLDTHPCVCKYAYMFLRRTLLILLVLATLPAACSGPVPIRGTGEEAMPPAGWVAYCDRHPADPSCLEVYR
jgi:hypothetical protein